MTATATHPVAVDPKWIKTASDHQAVAEGCYFDLAAAERVREFFRRFIRIADPHNVRKTRPFELLEWQWEDVIAPLFGWRRPGGTRRFRLAWIEIGKKNGKSTLAAAILLYLFIADEEPEPELYSAATTRPQAAIIFKEAARMVAKSPGLRKLIETKEHIKRLVCLRNGGFYQVLPNRPAAVDGINAHGVVFDEIHRQTDRELWDALVYAGAARTQPMMVILTTAGDDPESIGYELHERAEKILSGAVIDTEMFAYIAAASHDDDPGDPATWRKANPSLGVTVQQSALAAEYARAKDSPAALQNFKRLRLNMWVGKISRWLDFDRWAACPPRTPMEELAGRDCYGGLDLSSKYDITAFTLQFPALGDDGKLTHDVLAWFWLPEDTIVEAERKAGVPYRAWAERGLIELTPGDYIDYSFIRRRVGELGEQYAIKEVAFDPAYAGQIAIEIQDQLTIPTFQFKTNHYYYNPVCRYLESAMIEGRLRHGGNPILNWMASNIEVVENADGLIKPAKPRTHAKIDGIVSLAMSMGQHCKADKQEQTEVYEGDSPIIWIGA